jgi:hypothetical protein
MPSSSGKKNRYFNAIANNDGADDGQDIEIFASVFHFFT